MKTFIYFDWTKKNIQSPLTLNQSRPTDNCFTARRFGQWLGLLMASALVGCALPNTATSPTASRALLQPLSYLGSGQTDATASESTSENSITLRRPSAVSAFQDDIYLVDTELNQIIRYNNEQKTSTPFTNLPTNAGMRLHAAHDGSVYISDPDRAEVLHFARDGTQLPSLSSPGNLTRPVSVTVNTVTEYVMVADGLLNQIIEFDEQGNTVAVIKPQIAIEIAAIATGPHGIYVTDRIGRQVVVLGWSGDFRYALGSKELGDPGAIVVTRDNIIFVSDNADQTIKGYRGKSENPQGFRGQEITPEQLTEIGKFVAEVGGPGTEPTNFNGIGGLALAGGKLLYAADSMNARVQVMTINRPCSPDEISTGKNHQDEPVVRVRKI